MGDEKDGRATVGGKPDAEPTNTKRDQASQPDRLVLERVNHERDLRRELKWILDAWQRRREVLLGRREPEPRDTDRDLQRERARLACDQEPIEEESDRAIIRWNYWRDIVEALSVQAEMQRFGYPIALESPYNEILKDLYDFTADLVRGLLRGNVPPFASELAKRVGHPPPTPRQSDAIAKIEAIASLAAQKEPKVIPNLLVKEIEYEVENILGIKKSNLDKKRPEHRRPDMAKIMLYRMLSGVPLEDRRAWAMREIERAADEYHDEQACGR